MPTQVIGYMTVTGSTQNIARVQDMYNRTTVDLDPYITGTLNVTFTAAVPKVRLPSGRVRTARFYCNTTTHTLLIRHGARDAPDLLAMEAKYCVLFGVFLFIDRDWFKRSNRQAIMALMSPAVRAYTASETWQRWRADRLGYYYKPYTNYANEAVDAYSDLFDPRHPDAFKRNISDHAALRTAIQASGTTTDPVGDPDPGGDPEDQSGDYPIIGGTYRPVFVSQFDDPGAGGAEEEKNCLMAAGAMLLDRHTMGAKRKTAHQVRVASEDAPRTAADLTDLRRAWSKFGETLTFSRSESWRTVMQKVADGHGAVVLINFAKLPRRLTCSTPIRIGHALYINEIGADGRILCFDPVCRPSDQQPSGRADILDSAYARQTTENQPHWLPQSVVLDAARSFNSRRSGVQVAYSRKTQGGGGGYGLPTGDVYAIGVNGSGWEDFTQAPAEPGMPGIVQRRWKAGTTTASFLFNKNGQLTLMDPEVVISGEEGMMERWNPAADGYGVKGRAFYKTPAGVLPGDNGVAFKAGRRHWYLHPWDIPSDYFWVDPPDWPEGREYGLDLIERANLSYGRQVLNVVNRGNVWSQIELGTLISIDLGLTGPHPDGTVGTVRVVGYSPDEDSGTMQLLCEWVEND